MVSVVDEIAAALEGARARSRRLLDPLHEKVLRAQHSPLMSPLIWDLAHIGNYEDLWLVRSLGGAAVRPEIDDLYDAFRQPRRDRPRLPLLAPSETTEYLTRVRNRALELLAASDLAGDDPLLTDAYVHRMVVQHEHQHNETMLATLQMSGLVVDIETGPAPSLDWQTAGEAEVPAGPFVMGTDTDAWALDNERPAHPVHLDAFSIDVAPVDNQAWIRFVEEGGYVTERLWSEAGWRWRNEEDLAAPQNWERGRGGRWQRRRMGRTEELRPNEPVQHVCWYEAEAFARWAGRRLPSEPEWEKANSSGVLQGVGHGWEWTSSDFLPYPGFEAFPYREYSEVFFGRDYKVLRGSSWATHPTVARPTFRNWDFPIRRQIFCGLRTAREA